MTAQPVVLGVHAVPATADRPGRDTMAMLATVVFAGSIIAFFVYVIWLERDTWFWMDDFNWLITFQDGDVLEASNGHLMVVPATLVVASLHLFGLDDAYDPLRLVAMIAYVGIAVAVWRHVRPRTGALIAAASGLAVLWFASNPIDAMYPSFLNHSIPLALTVVVAGRLERPDPALRFDILTTLLIAAAVSCSTTGLVVLAVVAAHVAVPRSRPRRWWLLCSPAAGWAVWYGTNGRNSAGSGSNRATVPSVPDAFAHTDNLIRMTFVDLGAGNPAVGYVLGAGFLLVMAMSVTRWNTCTHASLRWIAAAVAFVGLTSVVQNGPVQEYFQEPSRYRFVIATMLILAVAESLRGVEIDRRIVAASGIVIGASALVLTDGMQRHHHFLTGIGEHTAPMLLGAEAAGAGADRDRIMSDLSVDQVTVGQYLDLVERFGSPRDDLADVSFYPDAADAADRVLRVEAQISVSAGTCDHGAPVPASTVTVDPGSTVEVRSFGATSRVVVARFGQVSRSTRSLAVVEDGDSIVIAFPDDPVPIPWRVEGTGGAVLAVC